jgi:hypothetical protein
VINGGSPRPACTIRHPPIATLRHFELLLTFVNVPGHSVYFPATISFFDGIPPSATFIGLPRSIPQLSLTFLDIPGSRHPSSATFSDTPDPVLGLPRVQSVFFRLSLPSHPRFYSLNSFNLSGYILDPENLYLCEALEFNDVTVVQCFSDTRGVKVMISGLREDPKSLILRWINHKLLMTPADFIWTFIHRPIPIR